ncbi:alcohol dehydrogenase catalytic domain-containing protein [Propionibacteriaceae bacterium Y1700]|uniref:alcohol dehydrogenase catalytic domain-containing protein n=1 Tax=Microlunatus sp. Y1700 TaxID=3418487 RepID=UPI003DA77026
MKVEAVGVCASDLKCYHGAAKFWGDENRPAWAQTGITPGHEFVGEIVAGSEEAMSHHGVAIGDRIVGEQIVPCEKCRYCRRGEYWMCGPHDMFGFRNHNGAMAQYLIIPINARVHRVSKDLPPHHAAYAEPLSCALHAVERASITFGDVVVVAGAGPIGLGLVAGAPVVDFL